MGEKQKLLKQHLRQLAPPEAAFESVSEGPDYQAHIERAKASDEEKENAVAALAKMRDDQELNAAEEFALEAIILPAERPVVDIRHGSFETPPDPFASFGAADIKRVIEDAIPSVGRIELPELPAVPFGGTGFVVGENLLMTNRHVARLFTRGVGREGVKFRVHQTAGVDFERERDGGDGTILEIEDVVMVHPYWDMALLRVSGLGDKHPALSLAIEDPRDYEGADVAVIGFPAFDPRNNTELQNRIFDRVFNVKRLQPGRIMGRGDIKSFGSIVSALKHDASTLGGNSGSAVLHVETGQIIALHFAGLYLDANYAVPTFELSRDSRVVKAGLRFQPEASPGAIVWEDKWLEADPPAGDEGADTEPDAPAPAPAPATTPATPPAVAAPVAASGGELSTWTIPIEVSFRVGTATPAGVRAAAPSMSAGAAAGAARAPAGDAGADDAAAGDAVERAVEPFHEESYDNRSGYDERYLGIRLPMPTVTDLGAVAKLENGEQAVPYEHFSLVMHKERRLALFTAANLDSRPEKKKPEEGKIYTRKGLGGLGKNDHEKWFTDPRIRGIHQLPDKFFTKDRKSFDKGHVVRRDDVAWGDSFDEVRRANGDTFHVTNCSPQVANFNRSNKPDGVWGKLENLILKQAKSEKLTVFGGPILDDEDKVFHGVDDQGAVEVKIPSRYWKVIVARNGNLLESFAFLLQQDLSDVSFEEAVTPGVEFAVSPEWKERMVSIADLEKEIGLLRFPQAVHAADQIDTDAGESVRRG